MPRNSKKVALSKADTSQSAKWRYLLRNPDFQKDMHGLHCALRSKQGHDNISSFTEGRERIADKWGLLLIPGEAIIYWPGEDPSSDEIRDLEHYGLRPLVSYSPVESTELRDDRFLFLRVDLDQPAYVLLPLFEEELRQQTERRPRRRRRLDRVGFYLEVFDRAKDGLTFREIATELDRKPSTVKSAYITAAHNIFGPARAPTKARLPLAYFDPTARMLV